MVLSSMRNLAIASLDANRCLAPQYTVRQRVSPREVIRALVLRRVKLFKNVLGMDGVRPTVHSCLHFAEAIKKHDELKVCNAWH